MNKILWIIANWKSNKTISEALEWVSSVGPHIPKNGNLKVVICPTFSALSDIKKAVAKDNLPFLLAAQDLSPFGIGAYTGEEPAALLNEMVDLAVLGHSERRKHFGETDDMIGKKTEQALNNNIIPLVCVQNEQTPVPVGCRMIAYEPVWAISTGLTNTPGAGKADNPGNAGKVAKFFKQKYGAELEVIYGGSVNASNIKGFIAEENISGVLVGNASLDAKEFTKLCQIAGETL